MGLRRQPPSDIKDTYRWQALAWQAQSPITDQLLMLFLPHTNTGSCRTIRLYFDLQCCKDHF